MIEASTLCVDGSCRKVFSHDVARPLQLALVGVNRLTCFVRSELYDHGPRFRLAAVVVSL